MGLLNFLGNLLRFKWLWIVFFICSVAFAAKQFQGINATTLGVGNTSIDSGLVMEVTSTTLPSKPCPVMTTVQRDATTPIEGACVANSTTNQLDYYDGTNWVPQQTVTTKGDISTFSTAPLRLPVGTDDQILVADATEASGLLWRDWVTTKGDLLSFSTTPLRLAVGADNQVLTADSSEALGIKWAAVGTPVVTSQTSNYTILATDDIILADTSGGTFTITFPAAASNTGKCWTVIKEDTSATVLTLDGNAAETVLTKTTVKMTGEYDTLHLCSDGTNIVNGPGQTFLRTVTFGLINGTPYTVSEDLSQVVASVANTGTGRPAATFVTGVWGADPVCACASISALNNTRYNVTARVDGDSSTVVGCWNSYTDDGVAFAVITSDADGLNNRVICTGER